MLTRDMTICIQIPEGTYCPRPECHIPNNHVITITSNTFTPQIKGTARDTYEIMTVQHLISNYIDVKAEINFGDQLVHD